MDREDDGTPSSGNIDSRLGALERQVRLLQDEIASLKAQSAPQAPSATSEAGIPRPTSGPAAAPPVPPPVIRPNPATTAPRTDMNADMGWNAMANGRSPGPEASRQVGSQLFQTPLPSFSSKEKSSAEMERREYNVGAKVLPIAGALILIIAIAYLVGLGLSRGIITPTILWWGTNILVGGIFIFGRTLKEEREAFSEIVEAVASSGLFLNFVAGYAFQHLYDIPSFAALILGFAAANLLYCHVRKSQAFIYLGCFGGILGSLIPFHELPPAGCTFLLFCVALIVCFTAWQKKWADVATVASAGFQAAGLFITFNASFDARPPGLNLVGIGATLGLPLMFHLVRGLLITEESSGQGFPSLLPIKNRPARKLYQLVRKECIGPVIVLFLLLGSQMQPEVLESVVGVTVLLAAVQAGALVLMGLFLAKPKWLQTAWLVGPTINLGLVVPIMFWYHFPIAGSYLTPWLYLLVAVVVALAVQYAKMRDELLKPMAMIGLVALLFGFGCIESMAHGSLPNHMEALAAPGQEMAYLVLAVAVSWLVVQPLQKIVSLVMPKVEAIWVAHLCTVWTFTWLARIYFLGLTLFATKINPMFGVLVLEALTLVVVTAFHLALKRPPSWLYFLLTAALTALFLVAPGNEQAFAPLPRPWLMPLGYALLLVQYILLVIDFRNEGGDTAFGINAEIKPANQLASLAAVFCSMMLGYDSAYLFHITHNMEIVAGLTGSICFTAFAYLGFTQQRPEFRMTAFFSLCVFSVFSLVEGSPPDGIVNQLFSIASVLGLTSAVLVGIAKYVETKAQGQPFGIIAYSLGILSLGIFSHLIYQTLHDSPLGMNANAAVSVAWTTFAAILLALGFAFKTIELRFAGLAVFVATVLKVIFVDLNALDSAIRVAVCAFLGLALMGSGYVYIQRKKDQQTPADE